MEFICRNPFETRYVRDRSLENRIILWINSILNINLPLDRFSHNLDSGVVLCNLFNYFHPDGISDVSDSALTSEKKGNFDKFISSLRNIGVSSQYICEYEDLAEERNLGKFCDLIIQFATKVTRKQGYNGPRLADVPTLPTL